MKLTHAHFENKNDNSGGSLTYRQASKLLITEDKKTHIATSPLHYGVQRVYVRPCLAETRREHVYCVSSTASLVPTPHARGRALFRTTYSTYPSRRLNVCKQTTISVTGHCRASCIRTITQCDAARDSCGFQERHGLGNAADQRCSE